jgi:hypothetical protein
MTDRELLELAAKATGYGLPSANDHDEIGRQYEYHLGLWVKHPWGWGWFRPHIDDGQALRLAVVTDQIVTINRVDGLVSVQCGYHGEITVIEYFGDCMFAAVRRAITRAAAQIQLNKEAANE